MVARVNRRNWRTNVSASIVVRLIVPAPREGLIHRINWWQYHTIAEAGNILASSMVGLIEGPLPEGAIQVLLGQNDFRDAEDLHVLIQAAPGSSVTTVATADEFRHPFFAFPGGIWTVEDIWVGFATDGGVDNVMTSIGFEQINIGMQDWLAYRNAPINASTTGELIS